MPTIGWHAFTILLEGKPFIASMNNPALWPYFSPSYLQLGVVWLYLVPSLFLAHTCNGLTGLKDTLVISKCIWQFICNIMQINNSLNSKFSSFSTWSWTWNVLCIQIISWHYIWYIKSPLMPGNAHYLTTTSVQGHK